jgi:AMMECR1 domain-containing protein
MNLETKVIENILNIKNLTNIQSKYIKQIPKNAFGVFVTIRRSVKLRKYPEDIHGCIGYWSPDYSILTPKEIIKHMVDVTNSAMYNDTRREYFPPIENDPDSIIEIDFMLQPLIKINEKTGTLLPNVEKFKN